MATATQTRPPSVADGKRAKRQRRSRRRIWPIVLVGVDDYWRPLLRLIDWFVDRRYTRANFKRLFISVDGVDDVLPALHRAARPRRPSRPHRL